MKYILLLNISLLIGFNNPPYGGNGSGDNCPLIELNRTVKYEKEIERIAAINSDTIVALESIKLNNTKYSTVVDIKENENYVWFIVESKTKKDSLLIHYSDYVEYFQEINTYFDIQNCKMIIETIYSTEEEPECKSVDIVKF